MAEIGTFLVTVAAGTIIDIPIGSGAGAAMQVGDTIEIAAQWANNGSASPSFSYTGGTPAIAPTNRVAWSSPGSGSVSSGVWTWVVESGITNIRLTFAPTDDGNVEVSILRGVTAIKVPGSAPTWAGASATTATSPTIASVAAGAVVHAGVDIASGSEVVSIVTSGGTVLAQGTERRGFVARFDQATAGTVGGKQFSWPTASAYRPRAWAIAYEMAPEPEVVHVVIGEVSTTSVPVRVKSLNATSMRARIDGNLGSEGTPDSQGWAVSTVSGLSPNTTYDDLDIILNSTEEFLAVNSLPITTNQTAGVAFGTRVIALGTCFNPTTISGTDIGPFDNIIARNAQRMWMLGDQNYADNSSTSQSSHLADYENSFNYSSTYRQANASIPQTYMPGDHDFGGNNVWAGSYTGPTRNAALQIWAYQNRPNANGLYHSYVDGRVRFIFLDTRSFAVVDSTRLGSAQLDWLEDELAQSEPLKILTVDTTWIDNRASSSGGDTWKDPAGSSERTTISGWIDQPHHTVIVVHGDQHCLGADDGSGNPWGNCPVISSAPYKQNASHKTQNGDSDWSEGTYPTSGTDGVEQYTMLTLIDDGGSTIVAQSRGYDTSDTLRVSLDVNAPVPAPPSGLTINARIGGATVPIVSAAVRQGGVTVPVVGAAIRQGGVTVPLV